MTLLLYGNGHEAPKPVKTISSLTKKKWYTTINVLKICAIMKSEENENNKRNKVNTVEHI